MKQDYAMLNVDFDLWYGESDVHDLIPEITGALETQSIITRSEGAKIIRVDRPDDKEEFPPLIYEKKDGGYTYGTTDIATLYDRKKRLKADRCVYVVDQRQALHFKQVFRAVSMAGLYNESEMIHAGFGTINGKDGKPFKTRDGGVMRLTGLIELAKQEAMKGAGFSEQDMSPEIDEMMQKIAIAAIKYGDLSTNRLSDYNFDVSAFVQTEGNTGPYIQYAAVRIKSILEKAGAPEFSPGSIKIEAEEERNLALRLFQFQSAVEKSWENFMPSILCTHIYEVARSFNRFYKECPVMAAQSEALKQSRLMLCMLALRQIEQVMELLAIDIPDKMLRAEDLEKVA